jgi:UDP-N-acetylglucosamine--N-acetylmuramyl-(pentapeptide) pyrophosphoryl-undecaprenol N-acetylglucosamine transferase
LNGLLIAGGGTGGHIYPALAIAQAFRKIDPGIQIDFVGTAKGLESKIVPRENFPLHLINVGALNSVNIFTKLMTILLLPVAIIQACGLLLKLRPKFVLGVGGYASGPVMIAALLTKPFLKTKLALFEANAMPGLTNRWLAKKTQVSFTNFEASNKYFKAPLTVGMPIRADLSVSTRPSHEKLHVLVFGGSQGARGINQTVTTAVKEAGHWLDDVEIVHQIGSTDFKKFDEFYKSFTPTQVKWFEFLYDMPERYRWADLVICRAGASTLAELAACHKAAVLVPFPFASDNHQQENADAIAKENGAIVVLQKDFTPKKLGELIQDFKKQPAKLFQYENKIGHFFKARSAERVAETLRGDNI